MSFRLKAASVAALFLSAIAAVTATDIGHAAGAADANIETALPREAQPADASRVHFGPSREILQQLPATQVPSATTSNVAAIDAGSLGALVAAQSMPAALDEETRCLAGTVYFEAKSESLEGQLAVARVVINRRDSGRFADSICGVVYQPSQFSFVRGHSMPNIRTESRDWQEAVAIAQIALKDAWETPAEGALYFHARRVSPGWGRPRLASIDNHIFYR